MRVYFNLVVLALGLGALALALAASALSASSEVIPLVALGALALVTLAAALLSSRSQAGDLGWAFGLILLGGGGAFAAGHFELGPASARAWAIAGALSLPHLLLALAILLRSKGAAPELVRELIASEGPLENTLIALSLGGAGVIPVLKAELEASQESARAARCVELLGAFPRDPGAFAIAEGALGSSEALVRAAALRAMARIDPRRAAELAARAQDDPDPEVRAAAAAASA